MSWPTWTAAALLAVLCGCAGDPPVERSGPTPTVGGPSPTTTAPVREMDDLEEPIAKRLGAEVAGQGLNLEGLDCPTWTGQVPASLECEGWFDGVPGRVSVRLRPGKDGSVAFDAELLGGVMATARLVDDLVAQGYEDVDCGGVPAYPTDAGSTITCAVTDEGARKHVLATITDDKGGVSLSEF